MLCLVQFLAQDLHRSAASTCDTRAGCQAAKTHGRASRPCSVRGKQLQSVSSLWLMELVVLTNVKCMQAISTPVAAELPGSTEALRGLPSWQWPRTAAACSDALQAPASRSQAAGQPAAPAASQQGAQDGAHSPDGPAAASQAQVMSQLQAHVQLQSNAAACSAAIQKAGAVDAACSGSGPGNETRTATQVADFVPADADTESAAAAAASEQHPGGTSGAPTAGAPTSAVQEHPLDSSRPAAQPTETAAAPAPEPAAAAPAPAQGPSTGSVDAAHVLTAAAVMPGPAVKPAAKLPAHQVRISCV